MRGERVRLPSGGLRLSGELTKSGVFEYTDANGQVVREYRPPEEVSKADSLASIEDLKRKGPGRRRVTADMAHELKPHGISVVSLYPGLVRTESVLAAASQGWFKLDNSESPEFIGRVVAALAADPRLAERSGKVVVAAQAALELGVKDIDGKQPPALTLETV